MLLFYTPDVTTDIITLGEEESKHCVKVLRMQAGAELHLTDGMGTMCRCQVVVADARQCVVQVVERRERYGAKPYALHIAVSPTKNAARIEWLLEKAVEIGVDSLTLLQCEHSEHTNLRADRLQKIAISAMKQSLRAYLPEVRCGVPFADFVAECGGREGLYICHCDGDARRPLPQLYRRGGDATILIGPEGDFSQREIDAALQSGFKAVTLGSFRLRTETAAFYAATAVLVANDVVE